MSETVKNNLKESGSISRKALSWLRDHKLPTEPICYHVAYELFQSHDPDLKQRLECLGDTHAEQLANIQQIYHDFVVARLEHNLNQFSQKIDNIANQTVVSVSTTQTHLKSFSATLEEIQPLISSTSGDAKINVITLLIDETEKTHQYAEVLEEKLQAAVEEIRDLQQEHMAFRDRANRDALTQVLNRSGLKHAFESIAGSETTYPAVLMLADIDHFKSFNDEHGHLVGDSVLKVVATTLQNQIKHSDILARFGGEEFLILLPNTKLENGLIVAESLRKQIESLTIKKRNSTENLRRITLSIGISSLLENQTFNDAVEKADQALYRAKQRGRNCIVNE